MRITNAEAITPHGIENLPKFHGPWRNLFPTKKTRMKIGVVKAFMVSNCETDSYRETYQQKQQ